MKNITNDIIPVLKEVELFSGFDESILLMFAQNMKSIHLKKDETLFNKGDKESAMYIILEGSVQIHDNDYIFTTLNNKQFFGEYSLIDSAVRSATVTAVRDTKLLELQQADFKKVTSQRPELWESVLIPLIKRLRDYNIIEEKLTMRTIDIQKKTYDLEKEKENIANEKKELENINHTKDKFFTIIAHDLKNPFSTVISISDILLNKYDTYSSEKIIEYIEQINHFSRNAFNLLENLLQWARSQTGSLKINFKRANPSQIVDDIFKLYMVNAIQKNISLNKNIDANLFGYFDVDMVTTVFRNLLSNAIKFTNEGEKITVSATELEDLIKFEVKDTGSGIEPKTLDNLFRIDKKQQKHENEEKRGTGLGLILCKEFISKNGGEIWAESILGEGTSMFFTLPKAL